MATEQGKKGRGKKKRTRGKKEPAQTIFAEKTVPGVINLILFCHQNYTLMSLVQRESDPEREQDPFC